MSTKHIRSTADLVRFGASLKIECENCGAARTRTGPEIVRHGKPWRRRGADAVLAMRGQGGAADDPAADMKSALIGLGVKLIAACCNEVTDSSLETSNERALIL